MKNPHVYENKYPIKPKEWTVRKVNVNMPIIKLPIKMVFDYFECIHLLYFSMAELFSAEFFVIYHEVNQWILMHWGASGLFAVVRQPFIIFHLFAFDLYSCKFY